MKAHAKQFEEKLHTQTKPLSHINTFLETYLAVRLEKIFDASKWLITPIFLTFIAILTYLPSLTYDFQFDDIANIKKFFALRTHGFWNFAFKGSRWISYWINTLNYAWGKFDPFYYRLGTVTFHIITGLLVFYVTQKALSLLKPNTPIATQFKQYRYTLATLTALLFLLHPVQTQTVSYVIQGQLEGLANLFMMLIAALFLNFATSKKRVLQILYLVLIFCLLYLATGTKEIIIMAPFMLMLLDWFFIAQGDYKQFLKRIPLYVLCFAVLHIQYLKVLPQNFLKTQLIGSLELHNNVGNVITADPMGKITRWSYFLSQFKVILHYIFIFFWPWNISVDYDWVMPASFAVPAVYIPLLILLVIALALGLLLYNNKINPLAFGLLWFFIGLAPRSTFIPSTELVADYKTYFSSFGMFFVCAFGLLMFFNKMQNYLQTRFSQKIGFLTALLSFLALTIFLVFATQKRNTVWRSSEEFWFNIVQNAPLKARGYNNYAVSIAEKDRFSEAIPYLRKAIKLDQHYPDPWSNIAVCFNKINKLDLAISHLEEAIRINPSYPEFYNNLSSFYLSKKEYEHTKILAEHAVKLRRHYGKAYFNWARAFFEEGKKEEALPLFRKACLEADYDTIDGFIGYAECALILNKFDDAIIAFSALHQLAPNNWEYYFNLANAYFCNKNYQEACSAYQHLTQTHPEELRAWFNLGETYLELGDTQTALACFQKAEPLGAQTPQVAQRIAFIKSQNTQSTHTPQNKPLTS